MVLANESSVALARDTAALFFRTLRESPAPFCHFKVFNAAVQMSSRAFIAQEEQAMLKESEAPSQHAVAARFSHRPAVLAAVLMSLSVRLRPPLAARPVPVHCDGPGPDRLESRRPPVSATVPRCTVSPLLCAPISVPGSPDAGRRCTRGPYLPLRAQ